MAAKGDQGIQGIQGIPGSGTSITKADVEYVLTGDITSHTHDYEPIVTAGSSTQYYRGDKT